jgi:hypothetical protein
LVRDRFYRPGDWYIIDDITGTKRRASNAQLQWDNAFTGPASFSPRQPQDLVVGVRDDQSVPLPRPRQQNQFIITGTYVIAPAARGATSIQVASIEGFMVNAIVQIMLDSGVNFTTQLSGVSGNTLSWIAGGLPATVGTIYGDPIENAVILIGMGEASSDVELEDMSGVWLFEDGTAMAWGE